MTDYTDLPQVNALYYEQQEVQRAILEIDNGGTISHFTVTPKPMQVGPTTVSTTPSGAPVRITLPGPADPTFVAEARAALVTRDNAITTELATLGVTNTPTRSV